MAVLLAPLAVRLLSRMPRALASPMTDTSSACASPRSLPLRSDWRMRSLITCFHNASGKRAASRLASVRQYAGETPTGAMPSASMASMRASTARTGFSPSACSSRRAPGCTPGMRCAPSKGVRSNNLLKEGSWAAPGKRHNAKSSYGSFQAAADFRV